MPYLTSRSGGRIHYEVKGSGMPILFIHGWGFSSDIWMRQIEGLSRRYQTIAMDFRGHGKSDASVDCSLEGLVIDAADLISDLMLTHVNLVGWSMGGSVALKIAADYPDLISSLTLVSTTPRFRGSDDFPHGQPEAMIRRLSRQILSDCDRAMDRFCRLMSDDEEIIAEMCRLACHPQRPRAAVLAAYLKTLADSDLREYLERIYAPTLIVHGSNDSISLPGAASYMTGHIKKARQVTLPAGGHIPLITPPDWLNNQIEEFLLEHSCN